MRVHSKEVRLNEEIPFWFNPYNQLFDKIYGEHIKEIKEDVGNIKTIIIGSYNKREELDEIHFSINELHDLISVMGHEVVKIIIQRTDRGITNTYIGTGKAKEVKTYIEEHKIAYVVCNHELTPVQYRNLYTLLGVPVADRTMIVLELFKRNAKTNEARLQVKVAEYKYLLPRINSLSIGKHDEGRKNGAFLSKGSGESAYDLTQRRIKERIKQLEKEIEHRKVSRRSQKKSRENCFKVVLVGYTNAGKTTLVNALTMSNFKVSNNVFETLDSFYRKLSDTYNARVSQDIIIADTVGFMSDLPSTWFEGFASTVNEIKEADLLLHVIDLSNDYIEKYIDVVNKVLLQIGVDEQRVLYVFTKKDKSSNEPRIQQLILNYQPNICISTYNKEDIILVHDLIIERCKKKGDEVH